MSKLYLPSIPNQKLLQLTWDEISNSISIKSNKQFVSDIKNLSLALGEINRHHSKKLPETYFFDLQRKMTKVRRLVKSLNVNRQKKKKKDIIPVAMVDYWFSGETNEKLRKQAEGK